jgi:hypothetical protein
VFVRGVEGVWVFVASEFLFEEEISMGYFSSRRSFSAWVFAMLAAEALLPAVTPPLRDPQDTQAAAAVGTEAAGTLSAATTHLSVASSRRSGRPAAYSAV